MDGITESFLAVSSRFLSSEYVPKIRKCVERLSDEDIWWRPNDESNSVGNLILHLSGNVRQWIISGIGGADDRRERQKEFDRREGVSKAELLQLLSSTLEETEDVLRKVTAESLLERRTIQGGDVSVLEAIYHVVEHFAMHTGQIAYITKLRTAGDLGFYEVKNGRAKPQW